MRKNSWTSSLFVRLMLSFLLIVLIVLIAQLISYQMYMNSMQDQTIKNTGERLDNLVSKLNQYFNGVHVTLVEAGVDKAFTQVSNGGVIDNYEEKMISDVFRSCMNRLEYVKNIVLINKNSSFVVTQNGTFMKNEFFNRLYFSATYTEDFWIKETTKNFIYKYYPVGAFRESNDSSSLEYDLLPVAIKKLGNSNYILIAFIDVNNLTVSIEGQFIDDLYIYTEDNTMLFPADSKENGIDLPLRQPAGYQKINNYLVFCKEKAGLSYYKIVSLEQITDEIKTAKLLFLMVILLSLLISLFISVYLARRFNSPVKQILENMQRYELSGSPGNIMDLKLIKDNIQRVISQNYDYINDIKRKDAALKSLSYYARVKNINMGLNELLDEVVFPKNFILIDFKIHYRKSFFSDISSDKRESAIFIKELLQIYLNEYFPNAFTCQIESDQIMSIVEAERSDQGLLDSLGLVLEKLKLENRYIYFTVAASGICDNISDLNKVYTRVTEIIKYRRLDEENQVLTDDYVLKSREKFYFSIDQSGQFINSLSSAQSDKCIALMESILAYNIRMGVSEFYIKLLSMEFVSCCVKTLIGVYFDVPDVFEVTQVYKSLENCSTLGEFESVLQDFISAVVDYMKSHRGESDYIVDFVKKFVNQNFMKDISHKLLADKLNISRNYLSAYFKNKVGVNLSDYINNIRLKKSIELLKDPAVKIHEAGAAVGIENTNTFIRLFRKYTGKAPGEYRKSQI